MHIAMLYSVIIKREEFRLKTESLASTLHVTSYNSNTNLQLPDKTQMANPQGSNKPQNHASTPIATSKLTPEIQKCNNSNPTSSQAFLPGISYKQARPDGARYTSLKTRACRRILTPNLWYLDTLQSGIKRRLKRCVNGCASSAMLLWW